MIRCPAMTIGQLVLDYVNALKWPVVVIIIFLVLRCEEDSGSDDED